MTSTNNLSVQQPKVTRRTRKIFLPALAALVFAAISTVFAFQGGNGVGGIQGAANAAYDIGLWGDLPYSDTQANVGVPNLIADMNSQKLAFRNN
jgi:hypothetical protein